MRNIPGNGVCTLRAAIQETNARNNGSDGISMNPSDGGCSAGVCTISLTGALPAITTSVSISGPGAAKLSIARANISKASIFTVQSSGTVSISGITIANAVGVGDDGVAIANLGSNTLNATNCVFIGNAADYDGIGGRGGAIYNSSGTTNITNSIFEFNAARMGGAIFNDSGSVNVTNCTLDSNSSSETGGAITNATGVVSVIGSTFYNNGASTGGGAVSNSGGTINITNSTVYANIAFAPDDFGGSGNGGGILNSGGTLNLSNSTVTANSVRVAGGGVFNAPSASAVVNIRSTIVALNHGGKSRTQETPDVSGSFHSHGFNFIGKKNGSTGFSIGTDKKGTINSPLDPKLDANGLRNNGGPTQTVALLAGSPAIDKGTSISLIGTLTTDQRGFARTVNNGSIPDAGDGTDIGAFEFGAQ